MAKNLVIVESPAKAKTIGKFLGKDFLVESSFGHIADLPSKDIGVDVEGDFTPQYKVTTDKKAVVAKLKDLAKSVGLKAIILSSYSVKLICLSLNDANFNQGCI